MPRPDWGAAQDVLDVRRPHHLLPETAFIDISQALRNIPALGAGITTTVSAVRPDDERC